MTKRPIRLAVRALILERNKLLLVNAFGGGVSDLWCAPGGGADPHSSLEDNLLREVYEETGLSVKVGAPVMVNEFHAPDRDFHQVDVYFRARITGGQLDAQWRDPEGIVTRRQFFAQSDLGGIRYKPDTLADAAWGNAAIYDPLEVLVK